MGSQADEKYSIAADDQTQTIVAHISNRIHGVGREFKDAVEDKVAALKEDVSPIPAIVLDHVVSLLFDPKVEEDKDDASDPAIGDWSARFQIPVVVEHTGTRGWGTRDRWARGSR